MIVEFSPEAKKFISKRKTKAVTVNMILGGC